MPRRSWTLLGLILSFIACGPKGESARPAAGGAALPDTTATAIQPPAPHADTAPSPAAVTPPRKLPVPAERPPARPRQAAPEGAPTPSKAPAPSKPAPPAPAPTAAQAPDPWHPAPHDTLDDATYQGWKQFELNCSRCHGEYAVGTSFAPALVVSLKEGGTIPTKESFITTVCAGRLDKGMPSWCALGLEMTKIEEIYQYVKGRADGRIAAGRPALRQP